MAAMRTKGRVEQPRIQPGRPQHGKEGGDAREVGATLGIVAIVLPDLAVGSGRASAWLTRQTL